MSSCHPRYYGVHRRLGHHRIAGHIGQLSCLGHSPYRGRRWCTSWSAWLRFRGHYRPREGRGPPCTAGAALRYVLPLSMLPRSICTTLQVLWYMPFVVSPRSVVLSCRCDVLKLFRVVVFCRPREGRPPHLDHHCCFFVVCIAHALW